MSRTTPSDTRRLRTSCVRGSRRKYKRSARSSYSIFISVLPSAKEDIHRDYNYDITFDNMVDFHCLLRISLPLPCFVHLEKLPHARPAPLRRDGVSRSRHGFDFLPRRASLPCPKKSMVAEWALLSDSARFRGNASGLRAPPAGLGRRRRPFLNRGISPDGGRGLCTLLRTAAYRIAAI
jgi:hypothetical protein